jgi:hypothetical protein
VWLDIHKHNQTAPRLCTNSSLNVAHITTQDNAGAWPTVQVCVGRWHESGWLVDHKITLQTLVAMIMLLQGRAAVRCGPSFLGLNIDSATPVYKQFVRYLGHHLKHTPRHCRCLAHEPTARCKL